MNYSIAIDGPAGAGKSTVARLVAEKLNYIYVDTGAMYRAIAVYFSQNSIDPDDVQAAGEAVAGIDITISYRDGIQQVILNGENITALLRTEETGRMASKISRHAPVRTKLVDLQRSLAARNNVVMDGRDIGTTVLPDAFVKIYLTASVTARAKRRFDELAAKGQACDFEEIKADIEQRDYQDMHREISPLSQAQDAVFVDTSDMNISQATEAVMEIVNQKRSGRA